MNGGITPERRIMTELCLGGDWNEEQKDKKNCNMTKEDPHAREQAAYLSTNAMASISILTSRGSRATSTVLLAGDDSEKNSP